MEMIKEETAPLNRADSLRLNMRILADAFERAGIQGVLFRENASLHLEDVRLVHERTVFRQGIVYVLAAEEYGRYKTILNGADLILTGAGEEQIPEGHCVLALPGDLSKGFVLEIAQGVFAQLRDWDRKLHQALRETDPLDRILLASMDVFGNPMFIHDNNFFILSDPAHIPQMSQWERDKRTGRQMVPISLINDFRLDYEYLEGLKSRKPVVYSSTQTGYRILYRNLWHGNHYVGRVLADELRATLHPGDYYLIDYLGTFLETAISSKELIWMSIAGNFDQFLSRCIREGTVQKQDALRYLQYMQWEMDDRYAALQIASLQQDFSMVSAYATIGQIETQLPQSKALLYENCIYVIVNLAKGMEQQENLAWRLSVLMRESLLRIGVSSEFNSFLDFPAACRQAGIALEFGRNRNDTYWYYVFDDFKLDYIIQCAEKELPSYMLCSDALLRLKAYDKENRTDLYHTLQVYLKLEKNVLQTSKELFIHRSTLTYRLDKIQKIIHADLSDPKVRLELLISYYIEDNR